MMNKSAYWEKFRSEILENFSMLYKATGMTTNYESTARLVAEAVDMKTEDMPVSKLLYILGEISGSGNTDTFDPDHSLSEHLLFPMGKLRGDIKKNKLGYHSLLRYCIRGLILSAIPFDDFSDRTKELRKDNGPTCVICGEDHGEVVSANFLAPRYSQDKKVEYVPVCDVHFDNWYDYCPELEGRERKLIKAQ